MSRRLGVVEQIPLSLEIPEAEVDVRAAANRVGIGLWRKAREKIVAQSAAPYRAGELHLIVRTLEAIVVANSDLLLTGPGFVDRLLDDHPLGLQRSDRLDHEVCDHVVANGAV